jgi:hypothetical protein
MGADGWRVQLFRKGWNVTAWHRGLSKLAGAKGFRHEHDFQPWSPDSRALAFVTWDKDPLHLYEVAERSIRRLECGSAFVHSVQWSPRTDRLLVISTSGALLLDQAGTPRGSAMWKASEYDRPFVYWMKDGDCFLAVTRESATAKAMLAFYAGEDGSLCQASALDPADLVPYSAERFARLPRDRFCLVLPDSVRSVGHLLDMWFDSRFDRANDTLYLGVYRPVSEIYAKEGEWCCGVDEKWIAVTLAT